MFTPDYIVGLVDGEGSFTVYIRDPDAATMRVRRVKAEPKFYLKLVERDRKILDELQQFFGCGNVYFQRERRRNHQHCYRYEVSKRDDLEKIIIPFFRKHILKFPSKRKDFEIFCKMFDRIMKGEHRTKEGLTNLFRMKCAMH
jgi:hypothetical protein